MKSLDQILQNIKPLDRDLLTMAQVFCDQRAKPLGALGKMETIYTRLYAMFRGKIDLTKKIVMVYVADNGVVAEQVSANPQETTFIVGQNMLQGRTGLCSISDHVGSEICVVDIGCCQDLFSPSQDKIRRGTGNIAKEAAMTRAECLRAIELGYMKTKQLIDKGYRLFGTGEMGVGNTTTSAVVIAALLGLTAREVTGYGAGLTSEMHRHKQKVIAACLERYSFTGDALDLASELAGLDILGMVGTYLACAEAQLPCVLDGLISVAALLLASRLTPVVLDYVFASHYSTEPAYALACQHLALSPMILMDMRLGEGSGCPLAFFLMENAVYTLEHMPSFSEAGLDDSDYIDQRVQE